MTHAGAHARTLVQCACARRQMHAHEHVYSVACASARPQLRAYMRACATSTFTHGLSHARLEVWVKVPTRSFVRTHTRKSAHGREHTHTRVRAGASVYIARTYTESYLRVYVRTHAHTRTQPHAYVYAYACKHTGPPNRACALVLTRVR
eukprot:5949415-Pleurochrysis_carterae.AAC.1